jgi:hypothetical protein
MEARIILKNIVLVIILFSIYNSCEKEANDYNEIFIDKYQKLYGKWKAISVIGRKDFNTEPDFQYLLFNRIDKFKVIKDSIICEGKILIYKQTNDTLIIKLNAETGSHLLALSCNKLVTLQVDTLILDEAIDCTDAYKYVFKREI